MTDDYGEEWQAWFKQFRKMFKEVPFIKLDDDWAGYIRLFYEGRTPKEAVELMGWMSIGVKAGTGIIRNLAKLGLPKNKRLLHLHPTLNLARSDMHLRGTQIKCEITSRSIPLDNLTFKLNKPFSKKNNVGASSLKELHGVFIALEDDVKQVELLITWILPQGKTIKHHLLLKIQNMPFQQDHMFSTTVQYHRGNAVPMLLKPCAIYAFEEFFNLKKGETLDEAAQRHERVKTQISRLSRDKSGNVELHEEMALEYLPFSEGDSLLV